MRLIDADALGIGRARRDAFLIPEYADGWNSAIEHIENAPTVDIKTEVAREIFAEIYITTESVYNDYVRTTGRVGMIDYAFAIKLEHAIADLKNKYIGGVGE